MRYEITKEKFLNDAELSHLLKTLKRFELSDPRDTTLFYLALNTGARAQELLNTKRSDLDTHAKSIFIRGLKNSFNRDIPLPPWLFSKLLKLPRSPNELDLRLFPISYWRLVQLWDTYRPVKKRFHSLRHTFAVNLYRRTKDLKLLQMALGHKNWKNTVIYMTYQYSEAEMRRLILGPQGHLKAVDPRR